MKIRDALGTTCDRLKSVKLNENSEREKERVGPIVECVLICIGDRYATTNFSAPAPLFVAVY